MCCRGGFAVGVWASAVWVGAFRVSAVWGGLVVLVGWFGECLCGSFVDQLWFY